MLTPRSPRKIISALVAVVVLASGGPLLADTFPYITFDLRVASGGGKDAYVAFSGDSVIINVYAQVTGTNGTTSDDGFWSTGGFVRSSTGGLLGDLQGLSVPAPFNGNGSGVGTGVDYDLDGDMDIGGVDGYYPRSAAATLGMPTGGLLIGQIRFTVTNVINATTAINWVPNGGVLGNNLTVLYRDNVLLAPYSSNATAITVGAAVIVHGTPGTPPPPTIRYLTGTITQHQTIADYVQPTAGTTLILAGGADVTATGTLDMRNANGTWGSHALHADDATSGNAGTLNVGNLTVGYAHPGTFTQSAGRTTVSTLTLGNGANNGSFYLTGGQLVGTSMALANAGSRFEQSSGTATFSTLDAHLGTCLISSSAVLNSGTANFGPGTHQTGGTIAVAGQVDAAGLIVDAGSFTGGPLYVGQQDITQNGGDVNFSMLRMNSIGGYNLKGGTLRASNTVVGQAYGQLKLTGGSFSAESYITMGSAYFSGSQVKVTRGSVGVYDNDAATVTQSAGAVTFDSLSITPSSTYIWTGGTLEVDKDMTLRGTMQCTNSTLTLHFGPGAFIDLSHGTLVGTNNTTVIIDDGALVNFPAGTGLSSYFRFATNHGLSHVDGQPLTIPTAQSVNGSGTITGDVSNDGTLSPGHSPGAITIDGDYSQSNSGLLKIELGGNTTDLFDNVTVTGTASLDGLLDVELLNTYVPSAGDSFLILSSAGRTGTFDNAPSSIGTSGGTFHVQYSATGVTLNNFVAAAVPEPSAPALLGLGASVLGLRRRRR